jgi:type I restriction enzyme R subunit
MPNLITEGQIKQALLGRLVAAPGWATLNCFTADPANSADTSGRVDKREVILRGPLREAVLRLNPHASLIACSGSRGLSRRTA